MKNKTVKIITIPICVIFVIALLVTMTSFIWRYKKNIMVEVYNPILDWSYKTVISPSHDIANKTSVMLDDIIVTYVLETPVVLCDSCVRNIVLYRNISDSDIAWIYGKSAKEIVKRFGYYDEARYYSGEHVYGVIYTGSDIGSITYTLSPGGIMKSIANEEYEYDLLLRIEFDERGVAINVETYRDIPIGG